MTTAAALRTWADGQLARNRRHRIPFSTRVVDRMHAMRREVSLPAAGWPQAEHGWRAPAEAALEQSLDYRCNVCGARNRARLRELDRESPTCRRCSSSVRLRSMVDLLSRALFATSLPIPLFPRSDKCGIGLSDALVYAGRLACRLDYVNTFYHTAPRLDVCAVPDLLRGACDFVIASDVLEHVTPPVATAFSSLHALLRPGGVLIGSVPYSLHDAPTQEHYPELHDYRLVECDGATRLHNRRRDGVEEVFERPVFHGGEGETMEMRLFSRRSLASELDAAGFGAVYFCERDVPEWGIAWLKPWSIPFVALY